MINVPKITESTFTKARKVCRILVVGSLALVLLSHLLPVTPGLIKPAFALAWAGFMLYPLTLSLYWSPYDYPFNMLAHQLAVLIPPLTIFGATLLGYISYTVGLAAIFGAGFFAIAYIWFIFQLERHGNPDEYFGN